MLKISTCYLNSPGVIATQKYIEHIMKSLECTKGGTNEHLLYLVTIQNTAYYHYFLSNGYDIWQTCA